VITNADGTQVVSSLGWVDKGAIWVCTAGELVPRKVVLSDAKYLSIKAGIAGFFAVLHHWDGDRLEISAHTHSEPSRIVSRVSLHRIISGLPIKPAITFEGDVSVWERLPRAFTGFAFGDYQLLLTDHRREGEVQTFTWFDNSYDRGYQGIVDVTEIPDSDLLIVSIARDSTPVLYDPEKKQAVRKLALADRRGNPEFLLRASANEFWASDYDSIVKLDAKTLTTIKAARVQDAPSRTSKFIGNFCFDSNETLCFIARPFSGDAVVLEADSMRQTHRVALGRQPLDIGLLADGTVIARDWKTGDFLSRKF
jgi:hypothetical protein